MSWHSEPEHIGVGSTELQSGVWVPHRAGRRPVPLAGKWAQCPPCSAVGGQKRSACQTRLYWTPDKHGLCDPMESELCAGPLAGPGEGSSFPLLPPPPGCLPGSPSLLGKWVRAERPSHLGKGKKAGGLATHTEGTSSLPDLEEAT